MRKWENSKKGLAAVEMALALPILALLFLVMAEGANAMRTYSALLDASREGARHVLMRGDSADVASLVAALVADIDADELTTSVVTDPVANTVTVEIAYDYAIFGNRNTENALADQPIKFVAQTTMPLP